jgi:hypothetical protein
MMTSGMSVAARTSRIRLRRDAHSTSCPTRNIHFPLCKGGVAERQTLSLPYSAGLIKMVERLLTVGSLTTPLELGPLKNMVSVDLLSCGVGEPHSMKMRLDEVAVREVERQRPRGRLGAKSTYLGGSFDQYNRQEYGMWGSLTEVLRTGRPRTEINGQDHFESIYHDPIRFRSFVEAMTAGSLLSARRIAEQFPWEQYRTLCDIGTTQGCLPVQVALVRSHIEAIGFGLPELGPAFQQYAHQNGLSQRVQFKAGDFFNDILPVADVIVLGRVLHNWDLATKKMLLAKVHQALPQAGAVIVYDMLIDDDRSSSMSGLLSSLNMLMWTSAGFGYTGADCIDWMREAGFGEMRVERLAGGNSMVIGKK